MELLLSTISGEVKSEPKLITACLITWLHAVSCLWDMRCWQSILRKRVQSPGLSGDFGSKLVFLAVETKLKSTANWTKEMVGRILSPNELLPDFASQFFTRLLLSCCVVDGLCYNELGRVGQVFVSPEFRCALCKAKG